MRQFRTASFLMLLGAFAIATNAGVFARAHCCAYEEFQAEIGFGVGWIEEYGHCGNQGFKVWDHPEEGSSDVCGTLVSFSGACNDYCTYGIDDISSNCSEGRCICQGCPE